MDDEEEDDYMSDTFLQADTKPGLMPKIFLNKHKRKELAISKESTSKIKSTHLKEQEGRNAKLVTAIDESNKGYALLSKMGFKKGMGLGREGQGITEPIPLKIKSGRKGLGKDTDEENRLRKRKQVYQFIDKRRKIAEENLKGDFKNRMKDKLAEKQAMRDLLMSQKACEQLDSNKNIKTPEQLWYWPESFMKNEADEVSENEDVEEDKEELSHDDVEERLVSLTEYLRKKHFYCIWCGTGFTDEQDLSSNCPGNTFALHDE